MQSTWWCRLTLNTREWASKEAEELFREILRKSKWGMVATCTSGVMMEEQELSLESFKLEITHWSNYKYKKSGNISLQVVFKTIRVHECIKEVSIKRKRKLRIEPLKNFPAKGLGCKEKTEKTRAKSPGKWKESQVLDNVLELRLKWRELYQKRTCGAERYCKIKDALGKLIKNGWSF